jgi:putative hydrolase of the HAD superfamily
MCPHYRQTLYSYAGKKPQKGIKKLKFAAVAFDLDGTLYPNYRFYVRLIPFLLKEQRYLRAFGKARNMLRAEEGAPPAGEASFYERQARYMAKILDQDPEILMARTEKIIYRGWEPLFKKVKLFPAVIETLSALKLAGVKLGLLSDFPPEIKLKTLGLSGYWDTVLCSETLGALKPDPLPFRELARVMGFPPEEILYVGNSFAYDVLGARKVGMKTAWVSSRRKCRNGGIGGEKADFSFFDYRQLRDYMLT